MPLRRRIYPRNPHSVKASPALLRVPLAPGGAVRLWCGGTRASSGRPRGPPGGWERPRVRRDRRRGCAPGGSADPRSPGGTRVPKTPRRQPATLTIYAVSDATGQTAESVALAALVQFRNPRVAIHRRGKVRTIREVRAVVEQAAQSDEALILYTLVSAELRRAMIAAARRHGVEAVDLLGPVLGRLMVRLQEEPLRRPGAFKHLLRAHPREIEAVEFAVRHDDGRRPEGLDQAEIVLVGVSRTLKTPATLYLAYRGWLV